MRRDKKEDEEKFSWEVEMDFWTFVAVVVAATLLLVLSVIGMCVLNQGRHYTQAWATGKADAQQVQEQKIPDEIKMQLPKDQGSLGILNNLTIGMRWQTVFQHLH